MEGSDLHLWLRGRQKEQLEQRLGDQRYGCAGRANGGSQGTEEAPGSVVRADREAQTSALAMDRPTLGSGNLGSPSCPPPASLPHSLGKTLVWTAVRPVRGSALGPTLDLESRRASTGGIRALGAPQGQ